MNLRGFLFNIATARPIDSELPGQHGVPERQFSLEGQAQLYGSLIGKRLREPGTENTWLKTLLTGMLGNAALRGSTQEMGMSEAKQCVVQHLMNVGWLRQHGAYRWQSLAMWIGEELS